MATNDLILKDGTEKELDGSGAATIVNDAFAQASDANLLAADTVGYPMVAVRGEFTFATAADNGSVVNVYAKPLKVDGTNDQEDPDAVFPQKWVCALPIDGTPTAVQRMRVDKNPNPYPGLECEYWVENKGGQTISAGWKLAVIPQTWAPAAS